MQASFDAMSTVAADPAFEPDFGLLIDARTMDYVATREEARALASRHAETFKNLPVAVVVSRAVHYGVANQIAALTDLRGGTLRAIYDWEEAKEWLLAHLPPRK